MYSIYDFFLNHNLMAKKAPMNESLWSLTPYSSTPFFNEVRWLTIVSKETLYESNERYVSEIEFDEKKLSFRF